MDAKFISFDQTTILNMLKPYLQLIIGFLCSFSLFGQGFSISGVVKNTANEEVAFANVLVLKTSDSTLVKGVSADEKGVFVFKNVAKGSYYIKAEYIGASSIISVINVSENLSIGVLVINETTQQLDEVVVTGVKPVLERKADRLIFNVANSTLSQGSSWEILQQTPGLISSGNEVKIRNQSATVYINNRKVYLSSEEVKELLENYSAENIKAIEIIATPPASYDAEGGPVLNIITLKNIATGYKGSVGADYTYTRPEFPKYSLKTAHYYQTGKVNLFFNYAYAPKEYIKKTHGETNFINDNDIVFSRWEDNQDRETVQKTHATALILDYTINDRNSINISATALFMPDRTDENKQVSLIKNATYILDSTFTTRSYLTHKKKNISTAVSYEHKFATKGRLTWNGHHTKFTLDRDQEVNSTYTYPLLTNTRTFSFLTEASQEIDIYTTQLDWKTKFGSVTFNTGGKGAFIVSKNGITYYNTISGAPVHNNTLSDVFSYNEDVYSGYFSLARNWEKISLKAGLRAEHTISTGVSKTAAESKKLEYFELFPTFYLSYTINDKHSLSFDYARRINRPRYQDLNPFRYFLNENNYQEGNTGLTPAFSDRFTLNYTLAEQYYFDFYYRDNGNYISVLSFQDNTNQIVRSARQNVAESTSYGVDVFHSRSLSPWWYLSSYISIFHEDETFVAEESNSQLVTNTVDGFYGSFANYFTISKAHNFKASLSFEYLSQFLEGSYKVGETIDVNIGITKSFWQKRAVLSIIATDVLERKNAEITSKYLNQDNLYFARPETQYLKVAFTYKFGNFRLKDNKKTINTKETQRL